MRALTDYMSNAGKVCPMVLLVDGELKRNADDVDGSVDLSEGEKIRLREWIDEARTLCAGLLKARPVADSVRGDAVRRKVYKALKSDVDIVTKASDGKFGSTEIKYAIRPYSYGPFSRSKSFIDRIAVKFDQLEQEMCKDGECADSVRAILVSDDHFNILQTAVADLANTQDVLSSDGEKHAYLLCTLGGLIAYRGGNGAAEGLFRFVL